MNSVIYGQFFRNRGKKMTINKDYIISKYGEKAFAKVQDFLYCENKDILLATRI